MLITRIAEVVSGDVAFYACVKSNAKCMPRSKVRMGKVIIIYRFIRTASYPHEVSDVVPSSKFSAMFIQYVGDHDINPSYPMPDSLSLPVPFPMGIS